MENEAISRPTGCKPSSRERKIKKNKKKKESESVLFTLSKLLIANGPVLKGRVKRWAKIEGEEGRRLREVRNVFSRKG